MKRCRVGATYNRSPAQKVSAWARNNFASICFALIWSLGFHVVLFVIICIVRLLGTNIAGWWGEEDVTAWQILNSGKVLPIRAIGVIACFLYVFRDNLTKR